jgi:hypothetical protein
VSFGVPFLVEPVTLRAQSRVGLRLFEIAMLVGKVPGKFIPKGSLGFSKSRELVDAIVQPLAKLFVAHDDAIHRDDRKIGGHASVLEEVEQGRHEFPPGQVTSSAKNDEDSRFKLVIRFHASHDFSDSQ